MALSKHFLLAALVCGLPWLGLAAAANAETAALPAEQDVQRQAKENPTCCKVLARFLPGKVFSAPTPPYALSLASYWSQREQEVQPACIVIPESAKDVQVTVFVLNIAAKILDNEGCEFAVRSGGHTPFAGAANIQNGVTIDLQSLNQIDVASDEKTVVIGPGNRWINVYLKLDALSLATSGGRVAPVGVGGLTLGGGISFFSPRFGFVCDNVENFEIVLASGRLTNANAKENADLFKALKGGSGNFGVVTKVTLRLFPQGKFWGGFIGQPIDARFAQFQAFEAFVASKDYDPFAALITSYSYSAVGGWIIASNHEYTKPQAYPPVFKPFTDLRPQIFNTMRISNLSDFTVELAARSIVGQRQLFVTSTIKNSAATMEKYFNLANETLEAAGPAGLKTVTELTFSLSFQPLPQIILSKSAQDGGNSLGLDGSDGDLVNVLLTVQWTLAADDTRINTAAKALFEKGNAAAKAAGTFNPYLYLNYAADYQKPIASYGAASVENLKKVAKKYDPGQLFQEQVPGGFKLDD